MPNMFKAIFSENFGIGQRSPSFNDFSLHVGEDTESALAQMDTTNQVSVTTEKAHPTRTNVWQDTFSPQMNSNLKKLPRSYYDAPEAGKGSKTVWEEIIKSDTIRQVTFGHFDKNKDGLIDAADLRASVGEHANVEQLIKQADKNGDGKIDQAEFSEMLKTMW